MGELPDVARRSVLFAPFFRAKRNWLTHFVSMVFIYIYIYIHILTWFPCRTEMIMCLDKPVAEVSGGKNLQAKEEFAYRMCAGPPTGALPKLNFLCTPAFSLSVWGWCFGGGWLCFRGGDVMWYSYDVMWLVAR